MKTSILTRISTAALLAALLHLSSAGLAGARDRFEYDPTPKAPAKPRPPSGGGSGSGGSSAPAAGIHAVIAAGEQREVFNSASAPGMAFYVPETSPTIVQVVVQKGLFKKPVYFARGIRPGTVTGGLVPRALLDASGFRPNNITDAAKVQAAMKASPITITVR
jgi:hypothetical protein